MERKGAVSGCDNGAVFVDVTASYRAFDFKIGATGPAKAGQPAGRAGGSSPQHATGGLFDARYDFCADSLNLFIGQRA